MKIPKMETPNEYWQFFEKIVMENIPPHIIPLIKATFYAGMISLRTIIETLPDDDEARDRITKKIFEDLDSFMDKEMKEILGNISVLNTKH